MKGNLLINLGSPKQLSIESVKDYLTEFLSDDLVIDFPKPIQKFLVKNNCAFKAQRRLNLTKDLD